MATEYTLIPAEQAKEMSKNALPDKETKNWESLLKKINNVANNGSTSCFSDHVLIEQQILQLQEQGYTVKLNVMADCHQVSWENPINI